MRSQPKFHGPAPASYPIDRAEPARRPLSSSRRVEQNIRNRLAAGVSMLRVASQLGVGSGTVQRINARWLLSRPVRRAYLNDRAETEPP